MAERINIYFVRHGEAESDGTFDGGDVPGAGLSQRGVSQAAATAIFLQGIPFTRIYSSDQKRSHETAMIIMGSGEHYSGATLIILPNLRERSDGIWSGSKKDYIQITRPNHFQKWRDGTYLPDGAESFENQETRVWQALHSILSQDIEPHAKILCVTSGNVIRAVVGGAMKIPIPLRQYMEVDNCGVTEVRFEGEVQRIMYMNNTSHLANVGFRPVT